MKPKTFTVATLGCRTNQYESQAYQDQLLKMGYARAKSGEAASLCIVNTCTVTASADSHSRHAIRGLIRDNPGAEVVVTGCYADRDPDTVRAIEGVTHVIPNKNKETLLKTLLPEEELPEFSITRFEAHTRAFVKVQDGCNSFCTYCIIPYVRGRSHSRTISDIIREVKELVASGYKEVVLTGINIGDFDGDTNPAARLADLVRAVDAVEGLQRLRISSIDPDEVDDDLLGAILEGKTTCPSMHIVLQAGSNVVLKRMNRKYTRQLFFETVDRLKNAHADFTFTTDLIVGFPGETAVDFQETLDAIERVQFAKVHMFPYSERARTRAALYPDKVPKAVIHERRQAVLRAEERASYRLRERFLGRRMKILTETGDKTRPHEIAGHTENFLLVWIPKRNLKPNEIVEVDLVKNTPQGFVGEVVA